ncbi:MAG: hypothetical protein GXO63_01925 [Candidatus Micrarchaeota archaeon]|nr:hypothetical protein [Candidatus Micrarchaeota archaeon]
MKDIMEWLGENLEEMRAEIEEVKITWPSGNSPTITITGSVSRVEERVEEKKRKICENYGLSEHDAIKIISEVFPSQPFSFKEIIRLKKDKYFNKLENGMCREVHGLCVEDDMVIIGDGRSPSSIYERAEQLRRLFYACLGDGGEIRVERELWESLYNKNIKGENKYVYLTKVPEGFLRAFLDRSRGEPLIE